jgi:hypothetical protein
MKRDQEYSKGGGTESLSKTSVCVNTSSSKGQRQKSNKHSLHIFGALWNKPQLGRFGRTLLHCPCANHAHGDARPSLEIQPARKARYGQHVAIGHAPGCQFATERGQVMDAFRVFCTWEGITPTQAVERLRDQEVH